MSSKISRCVIDNKELIIMDNAITEHTNKYFSKLVKILPYSKTQYSNFPIEESRFIFSVDQFPNMFNAMQQKFIPDKNSQDDMFYGKVNADIIHEATNLLFHHITKLAEEIFDVELKNTSMYVNYADPLTHHSQHTDYGYEYSALYYPVEEWTAEDGGETVFIDDNGDIAYSVLPKERRVAFFDSNIPHIARGPAPLNRKDRYTIAFKFKVTKLKSEEREEPVVQRVGKPKDESAKYIK